MKPRTPNKYICMRCKKVGIKNSTKESISGWCDVLDMKTILHKWFDGAKKVNKPNEALGNAAQQYKIHVSSGSQIKISAKR